MINLSGIESKLGAISDAINQIASDRTHWLADGLSLLGVLAAAIAAYYSKVAAEAAKDAQQDIYRPILRPVDFKDHLAEHFYTLTIKNDGHGPLHDLHLEHSSELACKSLAMGEEKSLKLADKAYETISKNGKAKFTYADIYHRSFSTVIWIEKIPYGSNQIKDWKILPGKAE